MQECNPYILRLTNTSGANIVNYRFFDAQLNYSTANAIGGRIVVGAFVVGKMTVGLADPRINYNTLLAELLTSCIVIKRISLFSTTQVNLRTNAFIVDWYNTRGSGKQIPVIFKLDPYQNLNDTAVFDKRFILNGNTGMTIALIRFNSSIDIWLYPERKLSLREAKGLSEQEILYGDLPDFMRMAREMGEEYNWAL